MTTQLIAVDLDGTLLNSKKELPDGFIPIVKKLFPTGIRFVIASGRQYYNLLSMFSSIADQLYFFAENGALIYDGKICIQSSPFLYDDVYSVLCTANALHAQVVLSGANAAYITPETAESVRQVKLYYERYVVSDDPLSAAKDACDHIVKIALFNQDNACRYLPALQQNHGEMNVTLSGQNWVDLMRSGINKGVAMGALQKKLGITPDRCMAFGDYPNDLELIRSVRRSYAMKNGHPDLIAAATGVAPSNDEQGVLQVLYTIFPQTAL